MSAVGSPLLRLFHIQRVNWVALDITSNSEKSTKERNIIARAPEKIAIRNKHLLREPLNEFFAISQDKLPEGAKSEFLVI